MKEMMMRSNLEVIRDHLEECQLRISEDSHNLNSKQQDLLECKQQVLEYNSQLNRSQHLEVLRELELQLKVLDRQDQQPVDLEQIRQLDLASLKQENKLIKQIPLYKVKC